MMVSEPTLHLELNDGDEMVVYVQRPHCEIVAKGAG